MKGKKMEDQIKELMGMVGEYGQAEIDFACTDADFKDQKSKKFADAQCVYKAIESKVCYMLNVVEKVTLERVAKHFEEKDVYELFNCNHASQEIRNLKDTI